MVVNNGEYFSLYHLYIYKRKNDEGATCVQLKLVLGVAYFLYIHENLCMYILSREKS